MDFVALCSDAFIRSFLHTVGLVWVYYESVYGDDATVPRYRMAYLYRVKCYTAYVGNFGCLALF